jgi:hypothetical protein
MRTTGEVVSFNPPTIGTIRAIESSEETTGADVGEAATWIPTVAEATRMAATIRVFKVLVVMFFVLWAEWVGSS